MKFIENADWLKNHPKQDDAPISTVDTTNYTLKKVVMFSRHNIRAPFNASNVSHQNISNRSWIKWTSIDGQLSMQGGLLEVAMGQYFRKYFEQTGLIALNEVPKSQDVRVYSNSLQRTIATAKFFITGVFPVANIPVEHHEVVGVDDYVFFTLLPFLNDTTQKMIDDDLANFSKTKQFEQLLYDYEEQFRYLEQIIDFKSSVYAKHHHISEFNLDDLSIILKANAIPETHGTLRMALHASDALVLQYYEEFNNSKSINSPTLSFEQWRKVSSIKDLYCDVTFAPRTLAKLLSQPLLKELVNEMLQDNRKLSVLVGHDINIGAILSAIDGYDYVLPYSIEHRTPIGSKLVIEKWLDASGVAYANVQLVYFSVDQLRCRETLDFDNPPMRFDLTIKGLLKNADGLYLYDDIIQRFNDVIEEVDTLEKAK